MSGFFAECWRLTKFSLLLGVKSWPRITVSPLVGAFKEVRKEARRMHAEIDAFLAKESEEEPHSGGR